MSGTINTGGTAFPMQDPQAIHAYAAARTADMADAPVEERDRVYLAARAEAVSGMTLRDYFASGASANDVERHLQDVPHVAKVVADGPLRRVVRGLPDNAHELAKYRYADAMLRAREGGAA